MRISDWSSDVCSSDLQRANEVGLSAQQHQALLAIRGAEDAKATVGYIAERLILKPHSASELFHRLEKLSLIERRAATNDRRKSFIEIGRASCRERAWQYV